uniref:Uncharacterized protein n=1 Tax=Ascaris lumbricoides TaxID=6252 RepID=A0A0M3HWY4_ASCLU
MAKVEIPELTQEGSKRRIWSSSNGRSSTSSADRERRAQKEKVWNIVRNRETYCE